MRFSTSFRIVYVCTRVGHVAENFVEYRWMRRKTVTVVIKIAKCVVREGGQIHDTYSRRWEILSAHLYGFPIFTWSKFATVNNCERK